MAEDSPRPKAAVSRSRPKTSALPPAAVSTSTLTAEGGAAPGGAAAEGAEAAAARKKERRAAEDAARRILAAAFQQCAEPSRPELQQLAERAGITTKQASRWFRNHRHRVRDREPATAGGAGGGRRGGGGGEGLERRGEGLERRGEGQGGGGGGDAGPRSSNSPSPLDSDADEKSSPLSPLSALAPLPRKQARGGRAGAGAASPGKAVKQPAKWRLKLAPSAAAHVAHAVPGVAFGAPAATAAHAGSLFAHLGDGQDATPAWFVLDGGGSNSEAEAPAPVSYDTALLRQGPQGMAGIGTEHAVLPARAAPYDADGMDADARARYSDAVDEIMRAAAQAQSAGAPDAGNQAALARYDPGAHVAFYAALAQQANGAADAGIRPAQAEYDDRAPDAGMPARYDDRAPDAGMQARYDDRAPDAGMQARYDDRALDAGIQDAGIQAARQHREAAMTEEYRRAAAVWTELRRHFESPASAEAASAPYLLTDANGRLLFAPVFASNADMPPSVVSLIRSGNNGQIDQGILLGLRRLFELHRQYFVALAPYFLAPP